MLVPGTFTAAGASSALATNACERRGASKRAADAAWESTTHKYKKWMYIK